MQANQFNMSNALKICLQNVNSRKPKNNTSYTLYYSHSPERYEGQMRNTTIKALIEEFREKGGSYNFAVITKTGDSKPLRYFNRELSNKFYSMTRTKRK